jgi:hypothetical protein
MFGACVYVCMIVVCACVCVCVKKTEIIWTEHADYFISTAFVEKIESEEVAALQRLPPMADYFHAISTREEAESRLL